MRAIILVLSTLLAGETAAETLTARGVVRSKARLELRADVDAAVLKAPFADGARFAKGDVLVALDCRRQSAEHRAARAQATAAAIEAKSKRRLLRHGAVGRSEAKRATALSRAASAKSQALAERLRSCALRAPFDGRVVTISAKPGERPKPGEPILTVVDDRRLDIEIIAPSRWLGWVREGRAFRFMIDETQRIHAARIVALGAEVDPRTQTVTLRARLEDPTGVLPGMSGDAIFEAGR